MIPLNDKTLNIYTEGVRDYPDDSTIRFHRTESTTYQTLDILTANYDLSQHKHLVDIGCGKGRVLFYMHAKFDVKVTGLEINPLTFRELVLNKEKYLEHRPDTQQADIQLEAVNSVGYDIQADQTLFYIFNPFDLSIFTATVYQILHSYSAHPRLIDLVLYYVPGDFIDFLENDTLFQPYQTLELPGFNKDRRERIFIYRLETTQ